MVSSINSAGVGALGADPRLVRGGQAAVSEARSESAAPGDRVQIGDAAAWSAARESVRQGLAQLTRALDLGEQAQGLLSKIQELARNYADDPEVAETELKTALAAFAAEVETAIADGFGVVAGGAVTIQAEPGAAPLSVPGVDLRFSDGSETSLLGFSSDLDFDGDPAAVLAAAQRGREALQAGLSRLLDAARGLEAHQGFLTAASGAASGVRTDLDADAARLLALQVRQGLDGLGGASIANVEPQAVLSLFRG